MKTTHHLYFSFTTPEHNMVVNAVSFTERANGEPDIHRLRIIKGESDYFLSFNDPADAVAEGKKVIGDMMDQIRESMGGSARGMTRVVELLREARQTMLEDYGTSGDWAMEVDELLKKF